MPGRNVNDVRFSNPNFYVGNLSGAIDTLYAKMAAAAELNTEAKWKTVFNVPTGGLLPDTAMVCFIIPAGACTIGSDINALVSTLPQSSPTPWIPCNNALKIKISGTCDVLVSW